MTEHLPGAWDHVGVYAGMPEYAPYLKTMIRMELAIAAAPFVFCDESNVVGRIVDRILKEEESRR